MVSKRSLWSAMLIIFASTQHVANAQEASQPSPTKSIMYATQDDIDAIKADVQALRQDIAALTKAIAADTKPGVPADAAGDLQQRLQAIEATQQELLRLGQSQGLVIEQIAAKDERGQYYPQFYGNSEQSRESMTRAIDRTIPRLGKLIVTNNTDRKRTLKVNEDDYVIRPGVTREIEIRSGNFSTKYEREQEKYWHLGPSNKYTQRLFLIVDR